MIAKLFKATLSVFLLSWLWTSVEKNFGIGESLPLFQGRNLALLANNLCYWLMILVIYILIFETPFTQNLVQIRYQSWLRLSRDIFVEICAYTTLAILGLAIFWHFLNVKGNLFPTLILVWVVMVILLTVEIISAIKKKSKLPLLLTISISLILLNL